MATYISAIQVEIGVSSYTIPADATGVLIGFAFDSSTNGSTLSSCSLTGCGTFTVVSQVATVSGTFERCAGWAWADVSSPGSSKTFSATLSASASQGPQFVAVFVKDITAGSWVQAGASDNRDAGNAPSVTAASTTGSIAFAIDAKFNAAPGVPSGWTGLVAVGNVISQFAQVSSSNAPGASSTTFTSPSPDYSAASIVTLLASSAAPFFTSLPVNASVAYGATANFTATISTTGTGATYDWQDNRTGSFTSVADGSGGTTASFTTGATTQAYQGRLYRLVYTDSSGTVTSNTVSLATVGFPLYLWDTSVQSGYDVWLRDPNTADQFPISSVTETFSLSDSQSATGAFGHAVADSITLTDSVSATGILSATSAESVTLTDSQNATVAGSASQIDESITLTDSQSVSLVASATRAESITLTDSVSATASMSVTRDESVTLTDAQSSTLAMPVARAESVTFTDSQDATLVPAGNSQRDETITFTDGQSVTLTIAATRAESLTITDGATATGSFGHAISETVTLTDSQNGVIPTPGIDNIDEFITLTDAQVASLVLNMGVSDSILFVDSYSGETAAIPQTQRNLDLRRPLTRDRLRGIFGDHRAIKAFEQLDKDFAKLDQLIDGDGKVYGDVQRYGQDSQSAAVGNDPRFRRATYNASLQAQAIPVGVRTYIDGSDLTFYDGLIAKATFTWRFSISKTASGSSTSVFDIAFGTDGNVTDVARVSFTKPAGTAVADEGIIEIFCTIEQIGASGIAVGTFKLSHDSTVGHATTPIVVRTTVSSPFDTAGIIKAGLCITTGAGDVITLAHCQAKAEALT